MEVGDIQRSRVGRSKFGVPVWLSALAICSCLFGLYRLHADLLYFFRSTTPLQVSLRDLSTMKTNRYVQVSGKANYLRSALVEGRYSGFDHVFEITAADEGGDQGDGAVVFVEKNRRKRVSKAALTPVVSGRLLHFSDRVYAKNLAKLFRKEAGKDASISKRPIDKSTRVVIAGLKPREHWLRLGLALILLIVIGANIYALRQSRREAVI